MATISLPMPEFGKTTEETVQILMDTVIKLRKELQYALYHLDEKNTPMLSTIVGDIESNYTAILQNENEITLLAQDVAGNTSSINVMSDEISLLAQDVAGNSSEISVLSNEINLKVSSNGIISAINLSPEEISINASKINLNGVTSMNGLARVSESLTLGQGIDTYNQLTFDNLGGPSYIESIGSSYLKFTSDYFLFNGAYVDCSNLNVWNTLKIYDKINMLSYGSISPSTPGNTGDVVWGTSNQGTGLHIYKFGTWYATITYEVA